MIKRFLAIFLIFTTTILTAQRTSSSPYSFFGIGDVYTPKTVEQSSMGGLGVALSTGYHLNFINPALNSKLRIATYSLGVSSNFLKINDGNTNQSSNATSLSYVALGFPIGKKAGFSLGMQPLSSVGYSFVSEVRNAENTLTKLTNIQGEGGTNRLYGSFGINVLKGFSLGLEIDYIFGNIENTVTVQQLDVDRATRSKEKNNISGGGVKIGAFYETDLKNKLKLGIGSTVKFGNNLSTTGNKSIYTLKFSNTGVEIPRSSYPTESISGNLNLPIKTSFGASLGKEQKWQAGVEYEFQKAFKNNNAITVTTNRYAYGDSNRLSLGGFYIPKINSLSSYWNRVTYRAGLRFENTGLLVKGSATGSDFTQIKDFGINLGLGLPLPKQLSNINIGFEYGQRGTLNNNLIKENYYNVKLGISLNDINWFIKRKID